MFFFSQGGPVVWVTALAAVCVGSPAPINAPLNRPANDLVLRAALDTTHLEKRLSADFSMDRAWKDETLFAGSWVNHDGDLAEGVSLAVTCVDCYTKGSVTATLTDDDIIDPSVRLSFTGVEAYVDLGISVSAGATYAINLVTSDTPIGLGFPGLSVGVVFYVDLVFSLSDEIDLEGGFYVKLADDAYLEASVFGGEITDHFFDGLSSKSLPVTVKSGRATFKADLRLRVQCGAESDLPLVGIGAGAELAIFANIIEFGATLETTADCGLQSLEWWDLNVGAFAQLDVVVDWKTIGAIPTVSTTLLSASTLTQCWLSAGGKGATSPTITATTLASSPADVSSTGSPYATAAPSPVVTANPTLPAASASYPTTRYPLGNSSIPTRSNGAPLVTSTLYTTNTYTVTSCAASVVNCPASYQSQIVVTKTADAFTTVCPFNASVTIPSTTVAPASQPTVVLTDVVVLKAYPTPIVETFAPPKAQSTPIAAVENQVTATVVPAASSPAPYVVGAAAGNGKALQQWNGTAPVAVAYSTGAAQPSASASYAAAQPSAPYTAGASGQLAASLVAFVGAIAGAVVLL